MADQTKPELNNAKADYAAPTVEAVGSFEALTKWASNGGGLDSGFAAGTPSGSLTFSDPPAAG